MKSTNKPHHSKLAAFLLAQIPVAPFLLIAIQWHVKGFTLVLPTPHIYAELEASYRQERT